MDTSTMKRLQEESLQFHKDISIEKVNKCYEQTMATGKTTFLWIHKCAYSKIYMMNASRIQFDPIINPQNNKPFGVKVQIHYSDKIETLCECTSYNPLEESLASTYELYANYLLNKDYNKYNLRTGCLSFVHFNKPDIKNNKTLDTDANLHVDEQVKIYGSESYPENKKRKIDEYSFLGKFMGELTKGSYDIEIEKCPYIDFFYPGLQKINIKIDNNEHLVTAIYSNRKTTWSVRDAEKMFQSYKNNINKSYEEIIKSFPKSIKNCKAVKMINHFCERAINENIKFNITGSDGTKLEILTVVDRLSKPFSIKGIENRPSKVVMNEYTKVKETHIPAITIIETKNNKRTTIFTEMWRREKDGVLILAPAVGSLEKMYIYAAKHGLGGKDTEYTIENYCPFRMPLKPNKEKER